MSACGKQPTFSTRRLSGPYDESDLHRYVADLIARDLVFPSAHIVVGSVWDHLRELFPDGQLPEPDAACGDNKGLMLAFDDGNEHQEIEIQPDCTPEVFYYCRKTGESLTGAVLWATPETPCAPVQ